MAEEKTGKIFLTTAILAVICSLIVSVTAIGLGPKQAVNREQDRKKSILQVAGLYDPNVPIDEAFQAIETRIVNIDTGEYVADGDVPEGYDQRLATSTPDLSEAVPTGDDIAGMALYLASDDSEWVTGTAQVVDGGLITGKPWRKQPRVMTQTRPITMYNPNEV